MAEPLSLIVSTASGVAKAGLVGLLRDGLDRVRGHSSLRLVQIDRPGVFVPRPLKGRVREMGVCFCVDLLNRSRYKAADILEFRPVIAGAEARVWAPGVTTSHALAEWDEELRSFPTFGATDHPNQMLVLRRGPELPMVLEREHGHQVFDLIIVTDKILGPEDVMSIGLEVRMGGRSGWLKVEGEITAQALPPSQGFRFGVDPATHHLAWVRDPTTMP